jgi:hypothetical protein
MLAPKPVKPGSSGGGGGGHQTQAAPKTEQQQQQAQPKVQPKLSKDFDPLQI